jgi:enoyl-CoA hydratase
MSIVFDYTNLETLIVEKTEDYAVVSVNRPEALNALNETVLLELSETFTKLSQDKEVGAIILTGSGRSFVAGADIEQMSKLDPVSGHEFFVFGQKVMEQIEHMNKPVIAAVNGFALGGGCELAMSADIIYASEKAKFGQPEVGLGISPGFGGTQRLARRVGVGYAKYMIYSAEMIDAQEAYRIGLVQKVVSADELLEEVIRLTKNILSKAPIAVRASKIAIDRGMDVDLRTGVAFEAEAITLAFASADRKEGMEAFLAKRNPKFQNK